MMMKRKEEDKNKNKRKNKNKIKGNKKENKKIRTKRTKRKWRERKILITCCLYFFTNFTFKSCYKICLMLYNLFCKRACFYCFHNLFWDTT